MRIHLPLHHSQLDPPSSSSASSPLIQLGGDVVLVELQGELSYEGDKSDGVIGVIGLDRPDKPTLHLGPHHLLHGKFVNLQKPLAVIRKAIGPNINDDQGNTTKLEGDAMNEEEEAESSEEEEEENLFEQDEPSTPLRNGNEKGKGKGMEYSSSPVYPPLTPIDYSSDLEMASSPARSEWDLTQDEDDDEGRPSKRSKMDKSIGTKGSGLGRSKDSKAERRVKEKQKRLEQGEKERTRRYQVIGIVRRKVVFALRPEPLVAPTILPD
ncbi:hypothetical protein I302_107455 [Kwoniella bestiolae CBS 10118]|uniref:Chromosome transmission fidelity protein 8 n=1 Tax=Kwoniella bestiolae CBS 10118 TaxID=1296100 RepID=A0A1B9FYI6_9TREE|nr:hypothetical protein I302_06804 [Kwoniella bestiolae CBS 10118]OCF23820.1 hypothetical protein I302_06804 [Kwoniella bestiolae CBS 10118]